MTLNTGRNIGKIFSRSDLVGDMNARIVVCCNGL